MNENESFGSSDEDDDAPRIENEEDGSDTSVCPLKVNFISAQEQDYSWMIHHPEFK